jgi:hypothetical protein
LLAPRRRDVSDAGGDGGGGTACLSESEDGAGAMPRCASRRSLKCSRPGAHCLTSAYNGPGPERHCPRAYQARDHVRRPPRPARRALPAAPSPPRLATVPHHRASPASPHPPRPANTPPPARGAGSQVASAGCGGMDVVGTATPRRGRWRWRRQSMQRVPHRELGGRALSGARPPTPRVSAAPALSPNPPPGPARLDTSCRAARLRHRRALEPARSRFARGRAPSAREHRTHSLPAPPPL